MREAITLERLKERLNYDPETGIFVWRETFSGHCREGWPAGRMGTGKAAGYMRITVDNREYKAHRLAWFYMTGEWPPAQIDHINGRASDNRFANLRLCNQTQNKANSKTYKNSTTGIKGVHWNKQAGMFSAAIAAGGKKIFLGYFNRIEDAATAYRNAAKSLFGEFARTS